MADNPAPPGGGDVTHRKLTLAERIFPTPQPEGQHKQDQGHLMKGQGRDLKDPEVKGQQPLTLADRIRPTSEWSQVHGNILDTSKSGIECRGQLQGQTEGHSDCQQSPSGKGSVSRLKNMFENLGTPPKLAPSAEDSPPEPDLGPVIKVKDIAVKFSGSFDDDQVIVKAENSDGVKCDIKDEFNYEFGDGRKDIPEMMTSFPSETKVASSNISGCNQSEVSSGLLGVVGYELMPEMILERAKPQIIKIEPEFSENLEHGSMPSRVVNPSIKQEILSSIQAQDDTQDSSENVTDSRDVCDELRQDSELLFENELIIEGGEAGGGTMAAGAVRGSKPELIRRGTLTQQFLFAWGDADNGEATGKEAGKVGEGFIQSEAVGTEHFSVKTENTELRGNGGNQSVAASDENVKNCNIRFVPGQGGSAAEEISETAEITLEMESVTAGLSMSDNGLKGEHQSINQKDQLSGAIQPGLEFAAESGNDLLQNKEQIFISADFDSDSRYSANFNIPLKKSTKLEPDLLPESLVPNMDSEQMSSTENPGFQIHIPDRDSESVEVGDSGVLDTESGSIESGNLNSDDTMEETMKVITIAPVCHSVIPAETKIPNGKSCDKNQNITEFFLPHDKNSKDDVIEQGRATCDSNICDTLNVSENVNAIQKPKKTTLVPSTGTSGLLPDVIPPKPEIDALQQEVNGSVATVAEDVEFKIVKSADSSVNSVISNTTGEKNLSYNVAAAEGQIMAGKVKVSGEGHSKVNESDSDSDDSDTAAGREELETQSSLVNMYSTLLQDGDTPEDQDSDSDDGSTPDSSDGSSTGESDGEDGVFAGTVRPGDPGTLQPCPAGLHSPAPGSGPPDPSASTHRRASLTHTLRDTLDTLTPSGFHSLMASFRDPNSPVSKFGDTVTIKGDRSCKDISNQDTNPDRVSSDSQTGMSGTYLVDQGVGTSDSYGVNQGVGAVRTQGVGSSVNTQGVGSSVNTDTFTQTQALMQVVSASDRQFSETAVQCRPLVSSGGVRKLLERHLQEVDVLGKLRASEKERLQQKLKEKLEERDRQKKTVSEEERDRQRKAVSEEEVVEEKDELRMEMESVQEAVLDKLERKLSADLQDLNRKCVNRLSSMREGELTPAALETLLSEHRAQQAGLITHRLAERDRQNQLLTKRLAQGHRILQASMGSRSSFSTLESTAYSTYITGGLEQGTDPSNTSVRGGTDVTGVTRNTDVTSRVDDVMNRNNVKSGSEGFSREMNVTQTVVATNSDDVIGRSDVIGGGDVSDVASLDVERRVAEMDSDFYRTLMERQRGEGLGESELEHLVEEHLDRVEEFRAKLEELVKKKRRERREKLKGRRNKSHKSKSSKDKLSVTGLLKERSEVDKQVLELRQQHRQMSDQKLQQILKNKQKVKESTNLNDTLSPST